MTLTLQPTITLEDHRCYDCGRHWAAERFAQVPPSCPFCAGKELKAVKAKRDSLERSVRAYQAIFKRKKRR